MQGLLIIRWVATKVGHEVEAMKHADRGDAYFSELREKGVVAGHEWIANFTGDDCDMLVVRGDPQALMGVAASPEFREVHARGDLHLEGWQWDIGFAGATVDEIYPGWRELVGA